MTAAAKAAAEASSYAVTQYKRNGKFVCWLTKIGYHENDAGVRVRSWQYHGKDFPSAQQATLNLGKQWEAILGEHKKNKDYADHWIRAALFKAQADGYYLDANDNKIDYSGTPAEVQEYRQVLRAECSYPTPPVWPKKNAVKTGPSTDLQIAAAMKPQHDKSGTSINAAKDKYIAVYKSRVGLLGQSGIKADTAFSHERDLKLALKAFDVSMPVSSITRESIKQVISFWRAPDREIKERTSNNYLRAIQQFLNALEDMNVGYAAPKISDLFQFRKVKGEIFKYDKAKTKALLNVLDDRFRLYQLLALNCGFTQVDICNLKRDEIVKIKADTR
jgi:hypothetical protein